MAAAQELARERRRADGRRSAGIRRGRDAEIRQRAEQPQGQHELLEAWRPDRCARLGACRRASPGCACGHSSEARNSGGIRGSALRSRRHDLGDEHVPVAGATEDAGEPLDLSQQRRETVGGNEMRDQSETRAQPAGADTHLVDPFRIVVADESGRVRRDVVQAFDGDGVQRPGAVACFGSATGLARTGLCHPSGRPCTSACPRCALLAVATVSGSVDASAAASSNRRAVFPDSSSISISAIGTLRVCRRPRDDVPEARMVPRSRHSFARVPSGNATASVLRSKSVVNRGARRPPASASPSCRRQGVVASRTGSRCDPVSGHSYSPRACNAPPACASGGPLTVCSQRVPSRRTRTAMPASARRQSGVSKYVLTTRALRTRPRRIAATAGWRKIAMPAVTATPGSKASLSSISAGTTGSPLADESVRVSCAVHQGPVNTTFA